MQQWVTLNLECLNPKEWVLEQKVNVIHLIKTDLDPAAEMLIKVIWCHCKISTNIIVEVFDAHVKEMDFHESQHVETAMEFQINGNKTLKMILRSKRWIMFLTFLIKNLFVIIKLSFTSFHKFLWNLNFEIYRVSGSELFKTIFS